MKLLPKFILASSLLCSAFLKAQDPMLYLYVPHQPNTHSPLHSAITFSGEYTAGSDALTNSFMNSFYEGKFLDSGMINTQAGKLLPSNRIGAYASYSMAYNFRPHADSGKWEFTVAYRDRQVLFGQFTDDAFLIAFKGNRAFKGETANLGNTHLTQMHWQQAQVEAKFNAPDGNSDVTFGYSAINAQQLQEINLHEATIFTASDGSALDVNTQAEYFSSDTNETKTGVRNGSGSAFNFRFNAYFGDTSKHYRSQLSFMVQDLGFIHWNESSLVYSVDTNMHYTGVDASQLIVNGGTITGVPNSDSLIGAPKHGQIITFLPLGVRFRYTVFFPGSMWGGIDARAWSYNESVPLVSIFGGWHSANHKLNIGAGAGVGGYARLQIPLQVSWHPCDNFGITAGSTNITGYIAPKQTHGQGLYMNLTFAF
jgi:hypothetical protein